MRMPKPSPRHTYRLVLADDALGTARTIEFEAACPDSALYLAQQQCRGREAELFEDERSLGRIQCARQGGFWVLSRARQA
jgi:hypothetical protein